MVARRWAGGSRPSIFMAGGARGRSLLKDPQPWRGRWEPRGLVARNRHADLAVALMSQLTWASASGCFADTAVFRDTVTPLRYALSLDSDPYMSLLNSTFCTSFTVLYL